MTDILFFFDYSSSFLFFGPIIPGHALFVFGEFRHDTIAIFLQRVDICIFRPCTVILHFGLNVFFPSLVFVFMLCVSVLYPSHQDAPCMHSFSGLHFSPAWQSWTQTFSKNGCLVLFLFYLLQLQRQKQNRQLLIRACTCKSTHRFFCH